MKRLIIIFLLIFWTISCTNSELKKFEWYEDLFWYNTKDCGFECYENENIYIWWYDIEKFNWFNIYYKKEKELTYILNRWWYDIIHLWHKLDQKFIDDFPKTLQKDTEKTLTIVFHYSKLSESFLENLNNSWISKIELFPVWEECRNWEKWIFSQNIINKLIDSKNIKSFITDICKYDVVDKDKILYFKWIDIQSKNKE